MLRRLFAKFKGENTLPDNKSEKKRIIKECSSKIGINWSDIENLVFWKDPRVSLAVFIIATGFFWKFISYKLQKLGLVLIAAAVPFSFPETRNHIWRIFSEKFHLTLIPEKRSLGVDCDDVEGFMADCWIKVDQHYSYLLSLKSNSAIKFYLVVVSYLALIIIILTWLPLAGMLYLIGTFLYFYPILNYLDLLTFFGNRIEKLTTPFFKHWSHSQTKRKRDKGRKVIRHVKPHTSHSDIETEEFMPIRNTKAETLIVDEIFKRNKSDTHSSADDDEFQLQQRGEVQRKTEEKDGSDYDDDLCFLPSTYDYEPTIDEMPSMSNFDSMMEPLDDDFHAGLDFRHISPVDNTNDDSNFGVPSNYDDGETSEDIDDIVADSVEDFFGNKKASSSSTLTRRQQKQSDEQKQRQINFENYDDGVEFDVDQEFEFLDRTDLDDVTDEDIMEQNVGSHSHSKNVASGNNILGY